MSGDEQMRLISTSPPNQRNVGTVHAAARLVAGRARWLEVVGGVAKMLDPLGL
jgi:hypothetical protein